MFIQRQTQVIEVSPRSVDTRDNTSEKEDSSWICTKSHDPIEQVLISTDNSLKSHNLAYTAADGDKSTEVVKPMLKDRPNDKQVKVQPGVVSVIESNLTLDDKRLKSIKAVVSQNSQKNLNARQYLKRLCVELSKKPKYDIIVDGDWQQESSFWPD